MVKAFSFSSLLIASLCTRQMSSSQSYLESDLSKSRCITFPNYQWFWKPFFPFFFPVKKCLWVTIMQSLQATLCASGQGFHLPQIRPTELPKRNLCQRWNKKVRGPLPVLSEPESWSKRESQCFKSTNWGTSPLPILYTNPTLVLGIPKLLIPWVKAFLKAPIKIQMLARREQYFLFLAIKS